MKMDQNYMIDLNFFTATVINRLQGGFAYFTELKAVKIFRSEG